MTLADLMTNIECSKFANVGSSLSQSMPPRKGVVKSGNAGNSSKPSKEGVDVSKDDGKPPPLFPPGSKYPLSLLQERFVCVRLCYAVTLPNM
jgi:hypothetical protein